eukprot:1161277-Pelagomonas_calceolata.AAC.2
MGAKPELAHIMHDLLKQIQKKIPRQGYMDLTCVSCKRSRKGKGYIAVTAYKGSQAEALKDMPANKPDPSLKLKIKLKV